jgi:hypothetical protein
MSAVAFPISDMLVTVKSREVQRAMLAEMRGDRPSAIRHFLAAAHLELVAAADYELSDQPDLAWRSRISAASCFARAGDAEQARRLLEGLTQCQPDRADELRAILNDLGLIAGGSAV